MRLSNFESVIQRNPILDGVLVARKKNYSSVGEYKRTVREKVWYVAIRPFGSMNPDAKNSSPVANGNESVDECYSLYFHVAGDRKLACRSRMVDSGPSGCDCIEGDTSIRSVMQRIEAEFRSKRVIYDLLLKCKRTFHGDALVKTGYDVYVFPKQWSLPNA